MNLDKIKKQWEEYNEEFDNSDYMDIDTHTSMAMQVGVLLNEIERLHEYLGEQEHEKQLLYGQLNMIRDLASKKNK